MDKQAMERGDIAVARVVRCEALVKACLQEMLDGDYGNALASLEIAEGHLGQAIHATIAYLNRDAPENTAGIRHE